MIAIILPVKNGWWQLQVHGFPGSLRLSHILLWYSKICNYFNASQHFRFLNNAFNSTAESQLKREFAIISKMSVCCVLTQYAKSLLIKNDRIERIIFALFARISTILTHSVNQFEFVDLKWLVCKFFFFSGKAIIKIIIISESEQK